MQNLFVSRGRGFKYGDTRITHRKSGRAERGLFTSVSAREMARMGPSAVGNRFSNCQTANTEAQASALSRCIHQYMMQKQFSRIGLEIN
jgi:hypothetical protein